MTGELAFYLEPIWILAGTFHTSPPPAALGLRCCHHPHQDSPKWPLDHRHVPRLAACCEVSKRFEQSSSHWRLWDFSGLNKETTLIPTQIITSSVEISSFFHDSFVGLSTYCTSLVKPQQQKHLVYSRSAAHPPTHREQLGCHHQNRDPPK